MATEDNFIVAIELGSSKVTGIAGRKQPDGAIQILAFIQEPSQTFIRRGRINNVNKMTQCLSNMKEKLEQKLQKTISRVYVGIGGMGMHTVGNTVTRHLQAKVEVTQEMIDAMSDENRAMANADRDILEAIPQEYRLGTQLTTEPVGVLSESIEAHFLNIVTNASVRDEIRNCFRSAGLPIADQPITVLTEADAFLTESEKRSGCVFVDMGAETTGVAVFKNNILRHFAVLPLGGANVSHDIASLQIEDDEAETLKLECGSAIADIDPKLKTITLRDGRTISREEFNGLVEARVEEIIVNVQNQIALSKYDASNLIGGIILTGGAAMMKEMEKAFKNVTGFEKVRLMRQSRISVRNGEFQKFNADGDCNAAIALLDKGEINCCGGPIGQQAGLFDNEETEEKLAAKAAEEARKAEETAKAAEEAARIAEEERKKKEAEEKRKKRQSAVKGMAKKIGSFFSSLVNEKED